MKIVVTADHMMSSEQKNRLDSLGDVVWYDSLPTSAEEYLDRVKGADIVCSGMAGLIDAYKELRDVYVTVSFVSVAFVDITLMRKNGVVLSNAPGCNRHAVTEWIVAMMLLMSRNFLDAINRNESYRLDGQLPPLNPGLWGRNVTILGKGNVGRQVGTVAKSLDMNIRYFIRDDNIRHAIHDADIVIDTLSANPSTEKLLDDSFFSHMKSGSNFITISRSAVLDEDALIKYLDNGHIAAAATDCGGIAVGDTDDKLYRMVSQHPKIIATPHIAYSTPMSIQIGNDIMIDNVESYINGTPQNIVEE